MIKNSPDMRGAAGGCPEQQNIVSGRQRVTDEVSLDHVDPDPLGLACEPTTRHLASTYAALAKPAQRKGARSLTAAVHRSSLDAAGAGRRDARMFML
jgi:hypothetical protein